ncbi:MAG: hypothetical protein ABIE74_02755 [Pseudomonadota bacterium]
MRRQISLKSSTCTERSVVYATGISVKAGAHYPGRSVVLPMRGNRCREVSGWSGRSQQRA